jgi:hypothetical protein
LRRRRHRRTPSSQGWRSVPRPHTSSATTSDTQEVWRPTSSGIDCVSCALTCRLRSWYILSETMARKQVPQQPRRSGGGGGAAARLGGAGTQDPGAVLQPGGAATPRLLGLALAGGALHPTAFCPTALHPTAFHPAPPRPGRCASRRRRRLRCRRRGSSSRARPSGGRTVSRAFPSWNRSISTEIYLCHACSGHEIEDGSARTGREQLLLAGVPAQSSGSLATYQSARRRAKTYLKTVSSQRSAGQAPLQLSQRAQQLLAAAAAGGEGGGAPPGGLRGIDVPRPPATPSAPLQVSSTRAQVRRVIRNVAYSDPLTPLLPPANTAVADDGVCDAEPPTPPPPIPIMSGQMVVMAHSGGLRGGGSPGFRRSRWVICLRVWVEMMGLIIIRTD